MDLPIIFSPASSLEVKNCAAEDVSGINPYKAVVCVCLLAGSTVSPKSQSLLCKLFQFMSTCAHGFNANHYSYGIYNYTLILCRLLSVPSRLKYSYCRSFHFHQHWCFFNTSLVWRCSHGIFMTTLLSCVYTVAPAMFCGAKYTHHTFTPIVKH